MPQQIRDIPGIGEVLLVRRRGAKNIRLSVSAEGKVRISMPYWSPYQTGILFAKSRQEWLREHIARHKPDLLVDNTRIGRSYRLGFIYDPSLASITTRLSANSVLIKTPHPAHQPAVQKKAIEAAEKALKKEAAALLPQRLEYLARKYGFSYKSVHIRKMTSRWGSCSTHKVITLSYFLIQLPWELIDYVLLHELTHIEHMNHSPAFWKALQEISPNYKALRKQIRGHKPALLPNPL